MYLYLLLLLLLQEKNRKRGRNKIAAKLRRKQQNVIDEKSNELKETLEKKREEREERERERSGLAPKQGKGYDPLSRFVRKDA